MSPQPSWRQVGQLLMLGFAGPAIPVELRALAREFDLGGVVLFSRNIEAPEQVAELAADARGLGRAMPAWVAVDQEGGRVARLKHPFTEWPAAAVVGRAGDPSLAGRYAAALARELAAVGISLDLAPVVDVATSVSNPAIGDRAYAADPHRVAAIGRAVIEALQANGVAACAKHFPGHGDTTVDSHLDLPLVEHGLDRLRAVEFVPFRAAIEAGVAGVLVAHLLVPAIDESHPSSMSRAAIEGVLRGELGFDRLVLTDDLDMGAVAGRMTAADAVVAAVAAGADAALLCAPEVERQAEACEALVRAVESGVVPWARVERALARQRRAREAALAAAPAGRGAEPSRSPLSATWCPPGRQALATRIGTPEHQALAAEIRRWA